MNKEIKHLCNGLVDRSTRYAHLQLYYVRLKGTEQVARACGTISAQALFLMVYGMILFLLLISGALYIGAELDNYALGFLIMGAILIGLTLPLIIFKKRLLTLPLTNLFIKSILYHDENKTDQEPERTSGRTKEGQK